MDAVSTFNSFWDATDFNVLLKRAKKLVFQFLLGCYKAYIPALQHKNTQAFNSFWDATIIERLENEA